ncbi:MAG: hypothetical protein HXY23_03440, partial [Parvularculaceae bacterium]|nr:hypothetical protein [Parvularculaceae bacterium]
MTGDSADATAARPSVLDLQEIARSADLSPRRRRGALSRAARLQLIDILSRWAGGGLALVAGITIFSTIFIGRLYPMRAAIWTATVLAALFAARRLLKDFRTGARLASRPFRWRADYTASLSVLSAAFGAGAVIALPAGAPGELAYQTLALLIAASLGSGIIHAAHGRAAIAASLPAAVFIFWGAWRAGGASAALWGVGGAVATGALALFCFHAFLRQRAARRF